MLDFIHLSKALRWFRVHRGLKQRDVAAAADLSPSMLSGYEKGTRVPSLDSLARLLNALGVSLARLEEVLHHMARDEVSEAPRATPPRPGGDVPFLLPAQLLPASMLGEPIPSSGGASGGAGAGAGGDLGSLDARVREEHLPTPGRRATLDLLRNMQRLLEEEMRRDGENPDPSPLPVSP